MLLLAASYACRQSEIARNDAGCNGVTHARTVTRTEALWWFGLLAIFLDRTILLATHTHVLLLQHQNLHARFRTSFMEYLFCGFLEVFRFGVRYVGKSLRVAVHQGEPGALDLHHDAVALAEGVIYVRHGEVDLCHFARLQR